jgi:magnesium transporter
MLGYVLDGDVVRKVTDPLAIEEAHARGQKLWVDLEAKTEETHRLLSATFKLHPLVIEDVWGDSTVPKIEDYDHYLYVVVHGIRAGDEPGELQLLETDLVLGPNFIVTYHRDPRAVAPCHAELARSNRLLQRGPVFVFHAVLDHLVDFYMPFIDAFDEVVADIESVMLQPQRQLGMQRLLRRIFGLKRSLQGLRRVTVHQRDILLRLSRGEFDEIPHELLPFFRDVYDHFVRFTDFVESYRETVANTLELYLSLQSNRMNEVMKALTVMSTIMLPLTFIAGVYGMNFDHMPELRWPFGYWLVLGLMLVVAVAIVAFFRRKRWI